MEDDGVAVLPELFECGFLFIVFYDHIVVCFSLNVRIHYDKLSLPEIRAAYESALPLVITSLFYHK